VLHRSGLLRERLRATLTDAYAVGLLSHATFVGRLDMLHSQTLIEPDRLVGDLTFRRRVPAWRIRVRDGVTRLGGRWAENLTTRTHGLPIVALDWGGATATLVLGRGAACDITLTHATVSRRHATLAYRDGHWFVTDLRSRNGTWVNGVRVARCEVRAGDLVAAGDQRFWID
jgi:hypothetical protein